MSYFSTDITTKFSFLFQKSSFFSPPDRHITSLRHRGHHRLRLASRQQRLRQRGRGQHQGHSEGGSPESGGYSGGKCLERKDFVLKSRFTHFSLMAERMLLSTSEWQAYSGTPITVQRPLIRKSVIFCHFLSHCLHFFFSQRYNHNCAKTPDEKIDGVAVNNEDYPRETAEEKVAFLTNLSKIGPLK